MGDPITGTVTPNGPVGEDTTVTVTDDLGNTLATLFFPLGWGS